MMESRGTSQVLDAAREGVAEVAHGFDRRRSTCSASAVTNDSHAVRTRLKECRCTLEDVTHYSRSVAQD